MIIFPFFRNLIIVAILALTLAACDLMKPHEVRQKNVTREYYTVTEHPRLIGRMDGLYDEVQYPNETREDGVEGRVVVRFIIDEEGHPKEVKPIQRVHPLLDREAVRAVRQTRWTTENTPITMSLPISFEIGETQ